MSSLHCPAPLYLVVFHIANSAPCPLLGEPSCSPLLIRTARAPWTSRWAAVFEGGPVLLCSFARFCPFPSFTVHSLASRLGREVGSSRAHVCCARAGLCGWLPSVNIGCEASPGAGLAASRRGAGTCHACSLSAPTHRHGRLPLSLSREPPLTPAPHLRQIVAVLFSFRVELRSAFSLFDMDNSGMVGGWWLSHVGTQCNDVNLCGPGACTSWSSVGLGPGDEGLAARIELRQRRRVHIMSSVSTPVCRVVADQHERVSSRYGSPERPPHHLQN
jgi:hypothetical protein